MRITAEAKTATRERIIKVAAKLFAKEGYDNATTRGIAAKAGIAAGTLFNYFETKEASFELALEVPRGCRGPAPAGEKAVDSPLLLNTWHLL
jgi:AcrR family transcriptional regulator